MNDMKGFTMIELLIVLSVWTILITLVVKLPVNMISLQEEKEFLYTLKVDVLYAQSIAMGVSDTRVRIKFYDDNYKVLKGTNDAVLRMRRFPAGISVNMNIMRDISFDERGRLRQPGSFTITTPHTTYRVVLPLGKGRCYFVET